VCRAAVERSIGLVTALVPAIGYEAATELAREAEASGASVYELALSKKLLTRKRLEELLRPEAMVSPRR
jgi:aspartate ammonia-lyase